MGENERGSSTIKIGDNESVRIIEETEIHVECPERQKTVDQAIFELNIAFKTLGIDRWKLPEVKIRFVESKNELSLGRTKVHNDSVELVFDKKFSTPESEIISVKELRDAGSDYPGFKDALKHELGHIAMWDITGLDRQPATRLIDEGWASLLEHTDTKVPVASSKSAVTQGLKEEPDKYNRCFDFSKPITYEENLNGAESVTGRALLLWVFETYGKDKMIELIKKSPSPEKRNDDLSDGETEKADIRPELHDLSQTYNAIWRQNQEGKLKPDEFLEKMTKLEARQFQVALMDITGINNIDEIEEEFKKWLGIREKGMNQDIDFESLLKELNELKKTRHLSEPLSSIGRLEGFHFTDYFNKHQGADENNKEDRKKAEEYVSEKLNQLLSSICQRAGKEGLFDNLDALIDACLLATGKSVKGYKDRGDHGQDVAAYQPSTGVIHLSNLKLNFVTYKMLHEIATYGFSHAIMSVDHEMIHKKQLVGSKARSALYELLAFLPFLASALPIDMETKLTALVLSPIYYAALYKTVVSLRDRVAEEMHAFHGSSSSWSAKDMMEVFGGGYADIKENRENTDRILSSYLSIKRLYALGLSDDDVAILVRRAKWNKKSGTYSIFENEIEKRMSELDLEEEDVDNMVLANDLKRAINLNKFRLLAQDAIKKAGEEIMARQ